MYKYKIGHCEDCGLYVHEGSPLARVLIVMFRNYLRIIAFNHISTASACLRKIKAFYVFCFQMFLKARGAL